MMMYMISSRIEICFNSNQHMHRYDSIDDMFDLIILGRDPCSRSFVIVCVMEVAILLFVHTTDIGAYIPGRSQYMLFELIEDVHRENIINDSHVNWCSDFHTASICMLPLMYPPTMIAIANRKQAASDSTSGTVGLALVLFAIFCFSGAVYCFDYCVYHFSSRGHVSGHNDQTNNSNGSGCPPVVFCDQGRHDEVSYGYIIP